MKRLHVAHVVPAIFGHEGVFGGAERYVLELARAMARLTPTTLVSFGKSPKTWQDGELKIVVVRNLLPFRRFVFDPIGPGEIRALADADVVHVHQTQTMMSSIALVSAHLRNQKVFGTPLGGAGYGLHRLFNVDRYFDGHLHISNFSRRAFGHDGAINATVILGGIDVDKFRPPQRTERRTALYAGRLLPHKGVNYLLEGVAADIEVEIVGRTWRHAQRYSDLLRRLAIGKRVSFHETFDDESLVRAYQHAFCIALPSVHTTVEGQYFPIPELLGQTLLEGMACGAPGITTDVCSLPEIVEDGVSGFIVPPNDSRALGECVDRLAKDPRLVEKMGRAARERVVSHFTWDRVVERCLHAYGSFGSKPSAHIVTASEQ